MKDFLNQIKIFLETLSVRDFLDILIFSFILFLFLLFFLRKRFLKIFFVFAVFFLLYFISNYFSLNLTRIFFGYFFQIIFILLLIVFQREIRSWFEFLANPKIREKTAKKEFIIDEILKAILKFSETKTGAIIVFENLEPIEHQLYHKVYLNSEINSQILESIFNKTSPLHDGAVLIKGAKIKFASSHLPLSENKALSLKGTRHRAGLGITEKSDAFSIVVSEETGEISFFEGGKFYFNVNEKFLREKLITYYQLRVIEIPKIGKFPFPLLKPFLIFIFAFFLSFSILFLQKTKNEKLIKTFEVAIEFKNLSENLILENFSPQKINLSLSGRKEILNLIKSEEIKATIDLSRFQKGGTFNIFLETENFNLKEDVKIEKIFPQKIQIKLSPRPQK